MGEGIFMTDLELLQSNMKLTSNTSDFISREMLHNLHSP